MYTYKLSSQMISIDYYTDDEEIYPEEDMYFSDTSIWIARLKLIHALIYKQRNNTIVYFPEVSIDLSAQDTGESVFLGAWTLEEGYKKEYVYKWNWEEEATFLGKYGLYHEGSQELLAIEQVYHQTPQSDEDEKAKIKLQERLTGFTKKYAHLLKSYAPEIGTLYFFLKDYDKAFHFLTLHPNPILKDLTYRIAARFEYGDDKRREYIKRHDALYDNYRPWS